MSEAVSASEQKSVFLDIKDWLLGIIPTGIDVSIANLGNVDTLAITPEKGAKRAKEYACGGYEIYLPFSIYFRAIADDDDTIASKLELLNDIGYKLEHNGEEGIARLELSHGREIIEVYQEITAIKYKQAGKISDFTASYTLIYSTEN